MANMVIEAKRVKSGVALQSMETKGMNAINVLKAIKIEIVALRNAVNNDPDYTIDDVNVVQQVIDDLLAEIATI